VKRAISKHRAKGTIDRRSYPATIKIDILAATGLSATLDRDGL
jgi:hypothetical protein